MNADRITKLGRDSGRFQGGEVLGTGPGVQPRAGATSLENQGACAGERPYPAVLVGSDLMQGVGLILDKLTGGQGLLH